MFGDLWDRFKLAITPESHAESVVNEVYSPEHRGMAGLPGYTPLVTEYDPEQADTPAIIVETKRAIAAPLKAAAAAVSGTLTKYAIIGGIFLVLLVVIYGFAQGFAQGFGRR